MEFKQFNELLREQVLFMTENKKFLFVVDVEPDKVWETYLDSFPPGTNEIFRERREFDCSCCRQFVRAFGNVVSIPNNLGVTSIWDFNTGNIKYDTVLMALRELVKSAPVKNAFIPVTRAYGTEKSHETREGDVITWNHFRVEVENSVKLFRDDDVGSVRGQMQAARDVLQRSFEELSLDSLDTVLDLIAQKSLYKGEEWDKPLRKFKSLHKEYHQLTLVFQRENYCWKTSVEIGDALSKIKNHSIGVLLTDLSEGMDLNDAVKRYETIVAPTNYKRPKAIFTKKMVEQAKATVEELGYSNSLGRRHASIEDITVNNILFANRDALKQMGEDVFDELAEAVPTKPQNFDRVEEVGIDTFVKDILPSSREIEVYLENGHQSNMVSLIAPKDVESKSMFKWNNGFSWAYAGNITDSMKDRVKAFGGKVDGVLRFSIQWNDNGDNLDDLDAHCLEPGARGQRRNRIYYSNMRNVVTGGNLDVDVINPDGIAVENITWPALDSMNKGVYEFLVHCYSSRGAKSGFTAEIEFNGQIYSFAYPNPLRREEFIKVANVSFDGKELKMEKEHLTSSQSSIDIWGLSSNKFHPVSAFMYSPNYWDDQKGIGHRHYLFLMKGCVNPESPNGFFNEFLDEDLMKHKRVFEALGSKMRVAESDDQLSGLGFSSTKRASLVCRVKGSFDRVIRLIF